MGLFSKPSVASPVTPQQPQPHRSLVRDERTYRVYPSDLSVFDAFRRFYRHLTEECHYVEDFKGDCIRFSVRVDDTRFLKAWDSREFLRILEDVPNAESVSVHSHWLAKGVFLFALNIDVTRATVSVAVEALDLTLIAGIHESVREVFRASNPVPERSRLLSKHDLKKSVFLAHRFDDTGTKAAATVTRLLRRLGFDTIEGEGYEARDIPGKVADRIRTQDIFLCVVTSGDTAWLLSEAAYAKALNKYLVFACEDGCTFNRGIVGADHEYMVFPKGQIEMAFIDLLYALPT